MTTLNPIAALRLAVSTLNHIPNSATGLAEYRNTYKLIPDLEKAIKGHVSDKSAEPTNADRIKWAEDSLAVFCVHTWGDDLENLVQGDVLSLTSDLIVDLLHLLRARGIDPDAVLQGAKNCFDEEEREAR